MDRMRTTVGERYTFSVWGSPQSARLNPCRGEASKSVPAEMLSGLIGKRSNSSWSSESLASGATAGLNRRVPRSRSSGTSTTSAPMQRSGSSGRVPAYYSTRTRSILSDAVRPSLNSTSVWTGRPSTRLERRQLKRAHPAAHACQRTVIVAAVSAACAASVSVGNKRPPGLAVTLSGHGATEAEPPLVSRGGGHLPGAASHRRPLHER